VERDINDILDDVRGMLMKIRNASNRSRNRTSDQEIAEEFRRISSLANFALKTLDAEFPRGDRPPIDAFLLDDD
jgi:hypothetical protein